MLPPRSLPRGLVLPNYNCKIQKSHRILIFIWSCYNWYYLFSNYCWYRNLNSFLNNERGLCYCYYLMKTQHHEVSITHWGQVTHICVSRLTITGSDIGLSPGRRQAIIWTNAGILLIRTLGTNFSEILGEIHSFSFSKMHLKISSATWRLFGLGLNELSYQLLWNNDPV